MAYVMTELCKEPSIPSFDYYNGILEGYRQNGLPTQPLKQAWEHCVEEVPRETERINRSACRPAPRPDGRKTVGDKLKISQEAEPMPNKSISLSGEYISAQNRFIPPWTHWRR